MEKDVSVVVPFYNEADSVRPLYTKINDVLGTGEVRYECVFVNDGSTDGTRAALDTLAAEHEEVRALHFTRNFGQSSALIAGLRAATGEYLLTLDGDLQNDPADLPKVLAMLEEYDFVAGYRVNRQDTWFKRLSSRVANGVRNAILHDGLRDTGCGLKGFRRSCLPHLISFNGAHRFFAVLVQNGGLRVAECPVEHHPRVHGVSKYGIHNRLCRGLFDLLGVYWLRKRYVAYAIDEER